MDTKSKRSAGSIERIKASDRERSKLPHRKELKRLLYLKRDKQKYNKYIRDRRLKIRIAIINHYTNGNNCCSCCGDSHIEFLCVDHIEGSGKIHRESVGGGGSFYGWLKKMKYPPGFRILCHNCNMSLGFYGYCPHSTNFKNIIE